jgi:hypothetical protein
VQNFIRSPIHQDGYRHLFSGHETFPLRYGWLKKAYDAVAQHSGDAASRDIFLGDDSIARFGVGKNMVASMRHWATCCGIICADDDAKMLRPTPLGDLLFGSEGLDPYLEFPATLWLLHWMLVSHDASRPNKTTWYWTFNHYPGVDFERDDIAEGLLKLAEARGWQRVAPKTVRNDVDCLVRTYEARQSETDSVEDALSSPLSELGLIRGVRSHFQLIRGPKRSLPMGVFIYALNHFWERFGANRTLSFEAVAHEPGAPGRVFLLDEADLAERLLALEDGTRGVFKWSETAGLKQILRTDSLSAARLERLLREAYALNTLKEAA